MLAGLPDRAAYAAAAEETARLRIRSTRDYPRAVHLLEEALAVHVDARDDEKVALLHGRLGIALSLHHSALDVARALEHLDAAERLQQDRVVPGAHGPRPGGDVRGPHRPHGLVQRRRAGHRRAGRAARPGRRRRLGQGVGAVQPRARGRVRRRGRDDLAAARTTSRTRISCGPRRRRPRSGPTSTCSTRRRRVPGAEEPWACPVSWRWGTRTTRWSTSSGSRSC